MISISFVRSRLDAEEAGRATRRRETRGTILVPRHDPSLAKGIGVPVEG